MILTCTISDESHIDEQRFYKFMDKVVTSKHKVWEYENEYRIINVNPYSKTKYSDSVIKSIYFGTRTPNKDIDKIMEILYNRNVKYYIQDFTPDAYGKMRFIDYKS